jgi:polyisoprenoid-binding protein YceI
MRNTCWIVLALCLPSVHVHALPLAPAQAAQLYRLDTANTRISFNIQHFGVQWVSARFPDFSGDFVLDREGAASRVDVSVQVATVDCTDSFWNGRLRSADWLDVQRYPLMSFHSTRVDFEGDGAALASGTLTLHGITQVVGLAISSLHCSTDTSPVAANATHATSGDQCSFVARARIKRSDYGLPHGFWTGGDLVDIVISGAGVRSSGSEIGRHIE